MAEVPWSSSGGELSVLRDASGRRKFYYQRTSETFPHDAASHE
jgi:hypothetical protein